jgi:decaprenylphospho-beta-D-ribofuranose 2-oxidase
MTYTVRTGFDLYLQALSLPRGSEILLTGLTIREMADIARHHGLVPIPLDLNPDTLAPDIAELEAAITSQTRAILVAHLFGGRVPLDGIIEVAKRNGLHVIEDCAQAFAGPDFTGHPESDLAMFSFGSIKTATALGGALIRVADPRLWKRMQSIEEEYPAETSKEYLGAVLTHMLVKLFTLPLVFGLFYRACGFLSRDFEQVINAVRNLPEGEESVEVIRKRPSAPLVAVLSRRLRTFDTEKLQRRRQVGQEFKQALPNGIRCLGGAAESHTHWVFPILVDAPGRFAAELRAYGFDSTTAGSALSVIDPPVERNVRRAVRLRAAYRELLYLPVYPEMPTQERARLLDALGEILRDARHLEMIDARRVYSARVKSVVSPRTIADIREVLEQSRNDNRSVCMMGTCHNLGGHAFIQGAVALDMKRFQRILHLDTVHNRITVESGITWDKIQEAINPSGLALMAMQSDNNFTVGGSISSNGHGRDIHASTVIESVLGFRLMMADGSVVNVNRSENSELFRLVVGGYGLFGIILDVDLALVENAIFEQRSEIIPLRTVPEYFRQEIQGEAASEFFIARPSIAPKFFLDETIITLWSKTTATRPNIFRLAGERNIRRDRFLFGLSRRYLWGKRVRWWVEKQISKHPSDGGLVSRNNAMRPPVSAIKMFEYESLTDSDVIQEFFVPISKFLPFMEALRGLLLNWQANLLGVTIRYVKQDAESHLSYAPHEDALAAVLYFNEPLSLEGRAESSALIRSMVQVALQHHGTFYLTYIRDIESVELKKAYPGIDSFFEAKRELDPENRFTSRFFKAYAHKLTAMRAVAGR